MLKYFFFALKLYISISQFLDCLEGLDAHTIKGYVLHDMGSKTDIHVPYPKEPGGRSEEGRAFHHGRFVASLRKASKAEPKYASATLE